jgi:hypothetical protein
MPPETPDYAGEASPAGPPLSPLSRLGRAARSQHWFTVFLELVILVLGVFLGIEVSNLNEERAFRAQEASYLRQLRDEIEANRRTVDYQQGYVRAVVDGGRQALAFLEGEGECQDECAALLVSFFHSTQVWGTNYVQTTWDELVRLGMPSDDGVQTAVRDFYLFVGGWAAVNGTPPRYRELVRGQFSPDASEVLWYGCYELFNGVWEVLTFDCVDDLGELDVTAMLRGLHATPEVAPELRFWVGQNITALRFYDDMLSAAQRAVAAIDGALGEA